MYLLDTVSFSEFFKRRQHPGFVRWIGDKTEDMLFISALTIGEIERGIEAQRGRDPIFSEALLAWLGRSMEGYGDRILPITTPIARRWGRLSARIGHSGVDLLIAATALQHGFVVATRNVRHFEPTGVRVENPFT